MTFPEPSGPGFGDAGERDVVGSRVLVGIQMINISRLSTDPVPLVPGTLITIAGQGPVDSNGAGKSSLIAAVSLMHADEQWRLNSGAATAAGMLFTARDAGQGEWGNAGHGYVIGVFADPDVTEIDDLESTALTVWIRINRDKPHLAVRWQEGLWIPRGNTDAGRAQRADPLWDQMVKRNGRNDIGARGMAEALFGDHVRCVSFLSTSVRATKTPNLLAQPLNEIGPDRIFDAIATLTGLDRELDEEQKLRATEHALDSDARETRKAIEVWEADAVTTEAAIARREHAREKADQAAEAWRNRLARRVVTAVQRQHDIKHEQGLIAAKLQSTAEQEKALSDQLGHLTNDEAFAARFQQAAADDERLTGQDKKLSEHRKVASSDLERLRSDKRNAEERALAADGRDEDTAREELAAAKAAHSSALEHRGVAASEHRKSQEALRAAESGDDLAPEQVAALDQEDVDAVALLDLVVLTEAEREEWEPRLASYRHAVVTRAPLDQAARLLAHIPGSTIIRADEHATESQGLPTTADGAMTVNRFLAALRDRHEHSTDPARALDTGAGVITLGGFSDPVTGRATRIAQAREAADTTAVAYQQAREQVDAAERAVTLAQNRLQAAQAATQAQQLAAQITDKATLVAELSEQREQLRPQLQQTHEHHEEMKRQRYQRDSEIGRITGQRQELRETRGSLSQQRSSLSEEVQALDVDRRLTQWQGTEADAQKHLAALLDEDQVLDETDWWKEAERLLREADEHCFPRDTAPEGVPAEIRTLREESNEGRGKSREESAQAAFPNYLRALRRYLAEMAKVDADRRSQIESERQRRTKALEASTQALQEQHRTTELVRSQLRAAIKRGLETVAHRFDELDRAYGGHGAALEFPDPEPPADPTQIWPWQVTPKWRRSDDHDGMVTYQARANTAQLDDKAVKLVCAAALASSSGRSMVLILDELGRNLGAQHRKDAVALFQNIGADHGITVLGALQDDMERYAIHASGEYIKLRRSSDSRPYNDPPVIVGQDSNSARIEMLQDWLTELRDDAEGAA
ncbi:chromosome segregation ATPase [Saccharopolyspora hattusasensis]|uniref:chromosome segregation ATPase n=1 Tax=Saccharopolyspora hattusasensis TaxID=1128679 RepID=UPI003D961629